MWPTGRLWSQIQSYGNSSSERPAGAAGETQEGDHGAGEAERQTVTGGKTGGCKR